MAARKLKLQTVSIFALLLALLIVTRGPVSGSDGPGFNVPLGIPAEAWAYFVPKDNPITTAKIELGRELFFDARLSADGKISCASCHDPKLAFTDGKKVSEGINGRRGLRNSPTILNAMFNSGQFWDGRAASLEAQALLPLVDPDEMGNPSLDEVVARINGLPEYRQKFQEVFNGPVTTESLAKAIAAFERTLVSGNSPFDRFFAGDRTAISEAAQRGFFLFRGKGRCTICHTFNQSFPFFSDQNFRNTGASVNHPAYIQLSRRALEIVRNPEASKLVEALKKQDGAKELGRFLVTGNSQDIGAFRTPSLRDVELTAPYFHDGSAATLFDVLRFYVKGGNDNPGRDWQLEPVDLNESEMADLVEFLKSLTSDDSRGRVTGDK